MSPLSFDNGWTDRNVDCCINTIDEKFLRVPKCCAVHCIVSGEEYTETAPSPWDFVTLLEEDRAVAIGNMHKNLVKIMHVVPQISRRTDTHTDVLIAILRRYSRGQSNTLASD